MSGHTRREFLGTALPGAVAAGTGLTVLQPFRSLAAEPQQPSTLNPIPPPALNRGPQGAAYAASRFGLELDGQFAGWIDSADGGDATSDVVLERVGPDHIQHKHLAGVKYQDITVTCGTGMSKNFYDWIKASFDKQFARKNGAVVVFDYNGKPIYRLEWSNALITEIGFPACDASSKDVAKMTIKFAPSLTRQVAGTQGTVPVASQALRKQWLASNFRLQIAGCQTGSPYVSKIGPITVKIDQTTNQVGLTRLYVAEPSQMDLSNLAVTIVEARAAEFYQWHEDFVVRGNNGRDKERGGTLEYLTPDLRESLFTMTFRGLGIFKFAPETVMVGNEAIRQVRAEMYCQDIGFTYSAAA